MHRDELPIPEPCHADWNAMQGGAAKRFCGSCSKHVHDLSALTAPQATRLLATAERPCVRYTVGSDGQILHASAARWPRLLALGAALLGAGPAFASGIAAEPAATSPEPGLMERVLRRAQEAVGLAPEVVVSQGEVEVQVLGEVAPPPPPPEMIMGAPLPPPPPVIMGKRAAPPVIPLPPRVPAPPVVAPPIPRPAPGETVIPEVEEALRAR